MEFTSILNLTHDPDNKGLQDYLNIMCNGAKLYWVTDEETGLYPKC